MAHKRGLVLGGGGARGAYQIGVWRAMRACGVDFDLVTGTSVGALNGAMLVQGDYERARRMWLRLTARDVANVDISGAVESHDPGRAAMREFLRQAARAGGVDISGLWELMRGAVDAGRFYGSPVDFGLVTVRYPAFEPVTLRKSEIPPDALADYLIASASCFPTFPAHPIGEERFVDGAYYDILPINLAIEMGATEIVAVDLEGIGLRRRTRGHGVPVTLIRPMHPLGATLLFDPDASARRMNLGYLDALRAFGRAEGGHIALRSGETRGLWHELAHDLVAARRLYDSAPRHGGLSFERFGRAVQNLAEWYALDVETLYDARNFCYELLLRFNAPDSAAAGGGARFGRRALVERLYALLRALSFGRGNRAEMRRLAGALQNETAAAMLLLALKGHLAGEPAFLHSF